MTRKELNQMCISPVRTSDVESLQKFLARLKAQNSADVPGLFRKWILTEGIVFLVFSVLAGRPSVSLLISLIPFGIMILAAYVIALGAVIYYNGKAVRRISRTLAHPKQVRCCPDCYLFVEEKAERTGIDVSSNIIRSALFRKSSAPPGSCLCVSLRGEGFFFDRLEQGCLYKIYSIDGKDICFVSQAIS